MLLEWLSSLTTLCPLAEARRLGYLHEAIAIPARYRRCREAWKPHLEQSQQAIRDAIARCEHKRTALVIGSGALLDIPLRELSEAFGEVMLVDIAHPRAALREIRKYTNVTAQYIDITEIAREICVAKKGRALPLSRPRYALDRRDIDLVVSANLLSQLPLLPERYLRKRGFEEAAIHGCCRQILSAHLEYLEGFDARLCLITDTEHRIYEGDRLREREDRLYGLTLPAPASQWRWHIAPAGEIDRSDHYTEVVCVTAL
ncbi:MAG: hypothetical protein IT567_02840 [Alphaproteobacteria bacterium]|nr:hypothetical protein [Alphaproteobacteria bacterium]